MSVPRPLLADPLLPLLRAPALDPRRSNARCVLKPIVFIFGLGPALCFSAVAYASSATQHSWPFVERAIAIIAESYRSSRQADTSVQDVKESGIVSRWIADRGYGLIMPSDGSETIFCHFRSLPAGKDSVKAGDEVTYKRLVNDRKGKVEAIDVRYAGPGDGKFRESAGGDTRFEREGSDDDRDVLQSGTVLKWNTDRGFGLIRPNDGTENIFCHVKSLADGEGSVHNGDEVMYRTEFNERKSQHEAVEVHFVRHNDGQNDDVDSDHTYRQGSEAGSVLHWNYDRGFGLIQPRDGGEELFFHVKTLVGGEGSVREGDEVTYTKEYNERKGKFEAADVRASASEGLEYERDNGGRSIVRGRSYHAPVPGNTELTLVSNETGNVLRWYGERGFGFIRPSDGSDDLFFHARALPNVEMKVPEGTLVKYAKAFNNRRGKLEALDVRMDPDAEIASLSHLGKVTTEDMPSLVPRAEVAPTLEPSEQGHDCTIMEELHLDRARIGDADAEALAQALPDCKKLSKLFLHNNNISDAGAERLAKALPACMNLQLVDLRWNRIGDAGAEALAHALSGCGNLRFLDLTWNKIGDVGVEALAQALPECKNLNVEYLSQLGAQRNSQAI